LPLSEQDDQTGYPHKDMSPPDRKGCREEGLDEKRKAIPESVKHHHGEIGIHPLAGDVDFPSHAVIEQDSGENGCPCTMAYRRGEAAQQCDHDGVGQAAAASNKGCEGVARAFKGRKSHACCGTKNDPVHIGVVISLLGDDDHPDDLCEFLDYPNHKGAAEGQVVDKEGLKNRSGHSSQQTSIEKAKGCGGHADAESLSPFKEKDDKGYRYQKVAQNHQGHEQVWVPGVVNRI